MSHQCCTPEPNSCAQSGTRTLQVSLPGAQQNHIESARHMGPWGCELRGELWISQAERGICQKHLGLHSGWSILGTGQHRDRIRAAGAVPRFVREVLMNGCPSLLFAVLVSSRLRRGTQLARVRWSVLTGSGQAGSSATGLLAPAWTVARELPTSFPRLSPRVTGAGRPRRPVYPQAAKSRMLLHLCAQFILP